MLSDSEIQQVAQLLRSGTAFQGMPESIAKRVAALMEMRSFESGGKLTQEGHPNEGHLMLVVSGEAEISISHRSDGGNLIHRLAKPGHVIGEVGFIDGQAHSATCVATIPTRVAVLARDDFIQMFEADALSAAQLMAGLLRLLALRIRHANNYMLAQDQQILQLQTELLSLRKAVPLRNV
jgi:CRP/FNR family transcriptional regulator, cyclic AMP receptor protein